MTSKSSRTIAVFFFVLILCVTVLACIPDIAFADTTTQYVKFEYLQRIKDTPFAEKVTTFINVPVYENNEIRLADVKKALQCSSFGVMQSTLDKFVYNAKTKTYTAVYLKSVYLNAKTVDGNSKNFYLDCNLSFDEYFSPFVKDDIMEKGCYDVFLNNIRQNYPVVQDIPPQDLYGYFGFIPIPKERNLNQLWSDMFDTTNYSGVLERFSYEYSLTNQAYKKLLQDYNHSWLEVAWKGFVDLLASGTANATFYLLYVDSQTTEAFIAENGASDINNNSGLIFNQIKDGATNVFNTVKNFFSDKKNIAAIIGIFIGILLLVGMVLAIVTIVKKTVKSTANNVATNSNSTKRKKR